MLIRVLLEDGEEELFNADCRVAQLLDAIKKKLKLPRADTIDLCTPEGEMKALYTHNDDNAAKFFTLRELCLAVKVQERDHSTPYFTPILSEYANNEEFLSLLNTADAAACCVRMKLKHPPPCVKTQGAMSDITSSKAGKQAATRGRKTRRNSAIKT